MREFLFVVLILGCLSASCARPQPSAPTNPTAEDSVAASATPNAPVGPTLTIEESSTPQRITFQSPDGTELVGTFWPAIQPDSPGVLLMHWNPGSREDWMMLSALLQGAVVAGSPSDRLSYAVLSFDFRGHGESGGTPDAAGYLEDARAALGVFEDLPGVDPTRIVMIGASIGADAAVDACGVGCIGAISISPGNYLGVNYADALDTLGDKPVLCVASRDDHPSPETCESGQNVGLSDYLMQFYTGSAHGMDLFKITEEEPALIDLIFAWLDAHVPRGS